ncbi:hypothetical protein LTS17_008272 [Exophiala oligosperma]
MSAKAPRNTRKATPEDQVDHAAVARECGITSKGASAKRYERLLKAFGTPEGLGLENTANDADDDDDEVPLASAWYKRKATDDAPEARSAKKQTRNVHLGDRPKASPPNIAKPEIARVGSPKSQTPKVERGSWDTLRVPTGRGPPIDPRAMRRLSPVHVPPDSTPPPVRFSAAPGPPNQRAMHMPAPTPPVRSSAAPGPMNRQPMHMTVQVPPAQSVPTHPAAPSPMKQRAMHMPPPPATPAPAGVLPPLPVPGYWGALTAEYYRMSKLPEMHGYFPPDSAVVGPDLPRGVVMGYQEASLFGCHEEARPRSPFEDPNAFKPIIGQYYPIRVQPLPTLGADKTVKGEPTKSETKLPPQPQEVQPAPMKVKTEDGDLKSGVVVVE